MDYSTYFSTRPTEIIAQDLLGRMLYFDNGKEKLGGYIVETEAYLGKKTELLIHITVDVVLQMKDYTVKLGRFIYIRKGNTSSLM